MSTHIGDDGGGMNRNVTSRHTCPRRTASDVERQPVLELGLAERQHPHDRHPADDETDEVVDGVAPEAALETREEFFHSRVRVG